MNATLLGNIDQIELSGSAPPKEHRVNRANRLDEVLATKQQPMTKFGQVQTQRCGFGRSLILP